MSRLFFIITAFVLVASTIPVLGDDSATRERLVARFGNSVSFVSGCQPPAGISLYQGSSLAVLKKLGEMSAAEARYIGGVTFWDSIDKPELLAGLQRCVNLESRSCVEGEWPAGLTDQVGMLPKLKYITAEGRGFDDHALEVLAKQGNLEVLMIHNTRFTSRGLSSISQMRKLYQLGLFDVEIGKCDGKFLRPLKEMHWLSLINTGAKDECLDELLDKKDLALLAIRGTAVTQKAMDRFIAARPDVLIGFEGELQNRELPKR